MDFASKSCFTGHTRAKDTRAMSATVGPAAPTSDVDPFSDAFLDDPYADHAAMRDAGAAGWLQRHGPWGVAPPEHRAPAPPGPPAPAPRPGPPPPRPGPPPPGPPPARPRPPRRACCSRPTRRITRR